MTKTRKPSHPGEILEEHYIKPLCLHLGKLAQRLHISRKTLHKLRTGSASITVSIALSLSEAFDTTPQFWLNLQQKYDLWKKQHKRKPVAPIVKNGALIESARNLPMIASHVNK
jgi:antitoxin HigA-1